MLVSHENDAFDAILFHFSDLTQGTLLSIEHTISEITSKHSTRSSSNKIGIGLEGKGEKSVLKLPFHGKSSSQMMKEKPQTLITGVSKSKILNDEEEPSINQSIVDCRSFVDVDEDGNVSNLCVEVCGEQPEIVRKRKGQVNKF